MSRHVRKRYGGCSMMRLRARGRTDNALSRWQPRGLASDEGLFAATL
jgi:hypothetical protein